MRSGGDTTVFREVPPFRLAADLAKYWTAEQAVQTAKWAMEVYGGMGVLEDYGVERLLREAMILNLGRHSTPSDPGWAGSDAAKAGT